MTLLSGAHGTCLMHVIELVLKHATGKNVRKRGGQVIDKFEEMDRLRAAATAAVSWLMDKKSKKRYKEFCQSMKASGRTARNYQPNSTRAGGIVLQIGEIMMAKFSLQAHYELVNGCTELSEVQFCLLAHVYMQLLTQCFILFLLCNQIELAAFDTLFGTSSGPLFHTLLLITGGSLMLP